ncbi:MAG: MFS transporter [Pseudolabrys sp.]
MMYVALILFMVSSLLCAAAPTIELLTLARVLQGLGGGGLMTLSQALIGEAIPPRERARYQGYIAAVAVSANTFGPVAGGYLTEHFGWQSIFLVNVPFGLVALVLTRRLPNPAKERLPWQADPIGLVLFTVFVTALLLALERVQHADVAALPLGAALLGAGLVALGFSHPPGESRAVAAYSDASAAPAVDLAQRRDRRLSRRGAGVLDHILAHLSPGRARTVAFGNRPVAGAADHRHRHQRAGDGPYGEQDRIDHGIPGRWGWSSSPPFWCFLRCGRRN